MVAEINNEYSSDDLDELMDILEQEEHSQWRYRGEFPGFNRLPDGEVFDIFWDPRREHFLIIETLWITPEGIKKYFFKTFGKIGSGYGSWIPQQLIEDAWADAAGDDSEACDGGG